MWDWIFFTCRLSLFKSLLLSLISCKPYSHRLYFIQKIIIYLIRWNFQIRKISQKAQRHDLIGPADPISNLHPVKYAIRDKETDLEKKLRRKREELQDWHQLFWSNHNKRFQSSKKEFETNFLKQKNNTSDQTISADEISVFYKQFLDENWKNHMNYLFSWYRKNIHVTFLHLCVLLQRFSKRIRLSS